MDNSEKIQFETNKFWEDKYSFVFDLTKEMEKRNKDKVLELLIENGVTDVRFTNKINCLSGRDYEPITQENLEKIKSILFQMMK